MLQVVTFTKEFRQVKDCLPSLMKSLQYIWDLSEYYGKEEHMVPLLERIAYMLTEKVRLSLDIDTIFRYRQMVK